MLRSDRDKLSQDLIDWSKVLLILSIQESFLYIWVIEYSLCPGHTMRVEAVPIAWWEMSENQSSK